MGFVRELTPAQYRLQALRIERDAQDIIVKFTLSLFNADGTPIAIKNYAVPLTQEQRATLTTFVQNKLDELESDTGLTML